MIYVYGRHKSGNEFCSSVFETWEEAITKIRALYNLDKELNQLGEYYYFAKEH